MIPISDDNPTLRTPIATILLLVTIGAVWIFIQGAGFDPLTLAKTTCDLGLVPGEITGRARVGTSVPIGPGLACVVDRDPINIFTPITSMFLHGGWGHVLGNGLFLWVFGNNVEDAMGRFRFLAFYLVCGIVAAATHVALDPSSPIPMVGASGAISGVMGAYLVLYPRAKVNVLFIIFIFIRIIPIPAYMMLLWWFAWQVIGGLPQLSPMRPEVSSGVAVWAHVGGFVAGMALVKLFENKRYTQQHAALRARMA